MELDEFVHQSIVNIMNGVRSAHKETGEKFELKNRSIEFDVAVTVTESTEKKRGMDGSGNLESKISVFGFDLGGVEAGGKANYNKADSSSNSVVSRLRFSVQTGVPIVAPSISRK